MAATDKPVAWLPEPGTCAGRVDPDQTVIPQPLAGLLDRHAWPSVSPWSIGPRARTVCEHVDYEQLWNDDPTLFTRHVHVGVPPPERLWEAKHALGTLGYPLVFDAHVEQVEGRIALAIRGAGVVGRMDDAAWNVAAALLTTCCAMVREPRDDLDLGSLLRLRPARDPVAGGARAMPNGVKPELWQIGDWVHTWWIYPVFGALREGCPCVAHADRVRAMTFDGYHTFR